MASTISVDTPSRTAMVEITDRVAASVPDGFEGACVVFCRHTTAGMTINENADPDVKRDLLSELDRLIPPDDARFRHAEGNSAAHMKASVCGPSVTVPVSDGRLVLGTWQGMYLCEFDGPRSRKVVVQFLAAGG